MSTIIKMITIVFTLIILSGCSGYKQSFMKRSTLPSIVDGKTTYADLVALYGPARVNEKKDDGTTQYGWIYRETGAFGTSAYYVKVYAYTNKKNIVVRHDTDSHCYDPFSNKCNEGKYVE